MTTLTLVGGTVVDGTGADPVRADVAVTAGRITAVGPGVARVGEIVDCSGLTLTPGLIDAHVHLGLSSPIGPSFRHDLSVAELAADIFTNLSGTLDGAFTTVRDCGGIDGGVAGVVRSGKVRGPRVVQCGPIQCQTGGHGYMGAEWAPTELWCNHHVPGLRSLSLFSDGPHEMRKNVRETFRRGADFLKLCVTGGVVSSHDQLTDTQLTVEEISVAVQEAKARGTYVTVHAHNNEGIRNAVAAGALCIEHGSQIDEETAALMAAHGVAHVPTLAVVDAIRDGASGLGADVVARLGVAWQGQRDAIGASLAAGVRIGLGSDLIGPEQLGRGRELTLRAELQPAMDVLVAATRTNSQILRIDHEVGTLEPGRLADVAVWASDPLADPTVFADRAQVALVVQGGRVVRDAR